MRQQHGSYKPRNIRTILFVIISIAFAIIITNIGILIVHSPATHQHSGSLICPHISESDNLNSFVSKKERKFIYRQKETTFYGYTFYPSLDGGTRAWHTPQFTHYIDHILDMGSQAGQNLIRPTDYWSKDDPGQQQDDYIIWKNMDYLICTAQQRGVFVIMDLSAFRWLLVSQGRDPYDVNNWKNFLHFVARRYIGQSAIAFYSIVGEPQPPKSITEMNKLVNFYHSVTDELYQADEGTHLISAGGFNHMEEETPALPWWHKIYALPHNDIVTFKTYSADDLGLISTISAYARQLKKPLVDEEFGLPQRIGDGAFVGGTGYNHITTSRAQFFSDVYSRGREAEVAGFAFWNMGCEMNKQSYEVNPLTPAVWQVVKHYAPLKPATSDVHKPLC